MQGNGSIIVDSYHTIFGKRTDTEPCSLKHTISDSFREWFCFLLRGYARSLTPQPDSLFRQKTGTSSKYIYLAKVGAMLYTCNI